MSWVFYFLIMYIINKNITKFSAECSIEMKLKLFPSIGVKIDDISIKLVQVSDILRTIKFINRKIIFYNSKFYDSNRK